MDPEYVNFELYRNDDLFKYIKSFNYLQFSHYRNLMEFIDNDNFQVQIFGHSCGMSDRTLLKAVFEHENCISIKPFYYGVKESNDFEKKSYSISCHFKSKAELNAPKIATRAHHFINIRRQFARHRSGICKYHRVMY